MIKLKVFDTDPDKDSWRVEDLFDFDVCQEFMEITPKADRSVGPLHVNWLLAKYLCECNRRESEADDTPWETWQFDVPTAIILALSGGHVGSIKLSRHPKTVQGPSDRIRDSDVLTKFAVPFSYRPWTRTLIVRRDSVDKFAKWVGHPKTYFADVKSHEFRGEAKADDALHERIEMVVNLATLKGVDFGPRKELHLMAGIKNQAMVGLHLTPSPPWQ